MTDSTLTVAIATGAISLIGSIGACVAAVAAWRAATATERAAEAQRASVEMALLAASATERATHAQMIASLLEAYRSNEMLAAMRAVVGWYEMHEDQAVDQFGHLRRGDYEAIRAVDAGRRLVSHHFLKIWRLFAGGYFDESALRAVLIRSQVVFLREKIEPLEEALNRDYDRSMYEGLGGIFDVAAGSSRAESKITPGR